MLSLRRHYPHQVRRVFLTIFLINRPLAVALQTIRISVNVQVNLYIIREQMEIVVISLPL